MKAILVIIGLVASNYVFQAFLPKPNWDTALDRSAMQIFAIGLYALILNIKKP